MAKFGGGSVRTMGSLSRFPSTRWQRWAGSDKPAKTFEQELQSDRPLGGGGKSLGNPLSSDSVGLAPTERRQYLKSGKYVGKDITRRMKGGR